MRGFILCVFLIFISCNKKEQKHQSGDKIYNRFSKLKEENLTKIDFQPIICLDTMDSDEKMIDLKIKNTGKVNLDPLVIKFHCPCISPPTYDSIVKPGQSRVVSLNFPITKKGNFSYPIWIYGNFYPYVRTIYVEGYKK